MIHTAKVSVTRELEVTHTSTTSALGKQGESETNEQQAQRRDNYKYETVYLIADVRAPLLVHGGHGVDVGGTKRELHVNADCGAQQRKYAVGDALLRSA